jgi:hypothetical protein
MSTARIQNLMTEYGLEIDDIRWFLSVRLADELLSYQTKQWNLIEEIWSGRLGDRLYRLEEQFLEDQGRLWESGQTEEGKVRDLFSEIRISQRRRRLRSNS